MKDHNGMKEKRTSSNVQYLFAQSFKNENGKYADTLTENDIKILQDHGLLKCFLPKSLGGLDYNLQQTLDLIEDCAYVNGSLGWLVQIGNGGNYFATNLTEEHNTYFFGSKNSVLTGSAMTGGIGLPAKGGYLISGEWKYASGSDYATVFTATVLLEDKNEIWTALVERKNVEIINDWNSLGLRNTSSHSFRVKNLFVPNEHIIQVSKRINYIGHPIFDLPFVIFAQAFFIHVLYGIFARFIEECEQLTKDKQSVWQRYKPNFFEKVNKELSFARTLLSNSKNQFSDYQQHFDYKNPSSIEEVRKNLVYQSKKLKACAIGIFPLFGMVVLENDNPVNIFFRDILTLTQHSLLNE